MINIDIFSVNNSPQEARNFYNYCLSQGVSLNSFYLFKNKTVYMCENSEDLSLKGVIKHLNHEMLHNVIQEEIGEEESKDLDSFINRINSKSTYVNVSTGIFGFGGI